MNHPKNQEMLNSQWDPQEPPQKSRAVKLTETHMNHPKYQEMLNSQRPP